MLKKDCVAYLKTLISLYLGITLAKLFILCFNFFRYMIDFEEMDCDESTVVAGPSGDFIQHSEASIPPLDLDLSSGSSELVTAVTSRKVFQGK